MAFRLQLAPGAKFFIRGTDLLYWSLDLNQGLLESSFCGSIVEILKVPTQKDELLQYFSTQSDKSAAHGTLRHLIALNLVQTISDLEELAEQCERLAIPSHHATREKWAKGVTVLST